MTLVPIGEIYETERFVRLKEAGLLIDPDSVGGYEARFEGRESAVPSASYWKGKRVLVTGASGMVGSTLIDELITLGAQVHGTIKRHAVAYHPNIEHHLESGALSVFEADLRDYGRVSTIIRKVEPHAIFHQAAESFVPSGIDQPGHVVENNCLSTVNVLEAARKEGRELEAVQVACSSEQYGFIRSMDELPVREENELRPTSTYAATKVFTEFIAKSYFYTYGTPAVITRTFNQEGPRRGPQFFTARVARQIARALAGEADKVVIGNPNSVRDFTHVSDSVRGQLLAAEECERGMAYNICSGMGITTGDYVRLALKTFGLGCPVLVDRKLLRPYERGEAMFDGFIGSSEKLTERTGWRPKKSVMDIIRDQVEFERRVRP